MTALVVRANAGLLPLPNASVDLVVTSPPYFALRSYTDGGEHYLGQIGSEPTPAEFLEALWGCTREWMRVLKPSGSIWVNLGDKYSGAQAQNIAGINRAGDSARTWQQTDPKRTGIPNKSLMGLPWRYAIGCIDQLGLILRAEVIWDKPNGLPESVTDRVRRSHEQWFHFTKQPRYFSAVDEIREPHTHRANGATFGGIKTIDAAALVGASARRQGQNTYDALNPLGKLPGSVWEIPSEPLTVPDHLGVDHFAAFPTEWPRRIIQGWSPAGICCECGEGRRPVARVENEQLHQQGNRGAGKQDQHYNNRLTEVRTVSRSSATITGYACACRTPDAPTRPSLILDPFGGTGTTALCASVLGRVGISVDLSADYGRLAQWRTQDPASRARAMRVEKPPVQMDGQEMLFA